MSKNQKGFSVVEAIIIFFVIMAVLGVLGWVGSKSDNKTSGKSTTAKTATSTKPSIYKTPQWAGYLKYGYPNSMTEVSGDWTVPGIIGTPTQDYEFSAVWIGIGGWARDGLIQIGTDEDEGNGSPLYFPFWECYPQKSNRIAEIPKIRPGDKIRTNITKVSSGWSISLVDDTNGQSFQKTVQCDADQSTAEWILEDPKVGENPGVLPKLSSFTFSNLTVNGKAPGTDNEWKILMTKDGKTIAEPTDLTNNGQSFKVNDIR